MFGLPGAVRSKYETSMRTWIQMTATYVPNPRSSDTKPPVGDTRTIFPKKDEAIRLWKRQGRQKYALHDAEHRSVRADAQRDGEQCNTGESGISGQRTQAIPQVMCRILSRVAELSMRQNLSFERRSL